MIITNSWWQEHFVILSQLSPYFIVCNSGSRPPYNTHTMAPTLAMSPTQPPLTPRPWQRVLWLAAKLYNAWSDWVDDTSVSHSPTRAFRPQTAYVRVVTGFRYCCIRVSTKSAIRRLSSSCVSPRRVMEEPLTCNTAAASFWSFRWMFLCRSVLQEHECVLQCVSGCVPGEPVSKGVWSEWVSRWAP